MNKQLFRLPEGMSSQARSVFWAAILMLVASSFNFIVALRQASLSGAWQAWTEATVVALFVAASLLSAILNRRGHTRLAIGFLIGSFLLTLIARNALTAGLGVVYALVGLAITTALSLYSLPSAATNRAIVVAIILGALLVLFDLYAPPYRQPAPEALLNSIPYVAAVISTVIIFLAAQHFRQLSLQTRLTALILVVTIPLLVGITAYTSIRAGEVINELQSHDLLENNTALAANVSTWLELHVRNLQEIATLPDIVSLDPIRQRPALLAIAATHPNLFLVQTTDLAGINIARNDDSELKDYHDRDWFLGAKSGASITFEVLISRTTGRPALNMSSPIRNEHGQIVGVASIVSELDEISSEVLETGTTKGHSITYIVDAKNRVVAHPDPTFTAEELRDLSEYPPVSLLRQGQTGLISFTDENGERWSAYVSTLDNGWGIITQQTETELLAPMRQFQRVAFTLITVGAAAMLILAWWVIRRMLQPIGLLTDTASAIAAGDLNRVAEVKSKDEIGVLASTFNSMTSQLRDLISSLEQRVTERTKALATSAEVSRRLSTIFEQKLLVTEVVEQMKSAFNYYHAQIYFFNETKDELVIAGGTGEAGQTMLAQGHHIPKGRGLVGRAAESGAPVLVSDTTLDPDWLPNPLLPETKSEAAIPISIGVEVLGVLDVQHNITDGLKQEDVDLLQSISNQVAIALQNIRSAEIVTKRATELQTVATISTATSTIRNTQEMLATVVRLTQRKFGLYHAHVFTYIADTAELKIAACGWKEGDEREGTHGATVIRLEQEQSLVARSARTRQPVIVNDVHNEPGWLPNQFLPDTASELAVPLIVGDQLLGVLDVQSDRMNAFTEEDANILTTLASQVASALQNANSYAEAQRQAERETRLNAISQKIQSATTIEAALQTAARELGHALGMRQTLVALEPDALIAEPKK